MGHDRFYIAAVAAPKPTHVAFRISNGELELLSGPAQFERIAEELRERFPDAEFSRELPGDLSKLQHNGEVLELEEMKSWHYIAFDRMVRRQLAIPQ